MNTERPTDAEINKFLKDVLHLRDVADSIAAPCGEWCDDLSEIEGRIACLIECVQQCDPQSEAA